MGDWPEPVYDFDSEDFEEVEDFEMMDFLDWGPVDRVALKEVFINESEVIRGGGKTVLVNQ